jgi:amino acid transporter
MAASPTAPPIPAESLFPSASALPRTVTWRAPIIVALGSASLVTVSLGPMAVELGNVSPLIWGGIALVGAAQCALLAELTSRFPSRAGGTPQYAHRVIPRGSPTLGALSAWSYWLAWTPGIGVNLILAATYLRNTLWAELPTLPTALALGAGLYAMNALGLRLSMAVAGGAAALALVPLLVLLLTPVFAPDVFDVGNLMPLEVPAGGGVTATILLIAKWSFVAAWAAYGAEIASTLAADIRESSRVMPRVMAASAAVTTTALVFVPAVLFGLVGAGALAEDPTTSYLAPAERLFGSAGSVVLGVMLAATLILTAQAFIVGSSRTIYQLATDGHLPKALARVNRNGVPIGSITCDSIVITAMIAVFGTQIVDAVAAANVAYLVVFILLPLAYLTLRRQPSEQEDAYRLRRGGRVLAITLVVFNALLLVIGGAQWGSRVLITGAVLTVAIVPLARLSRRAISPTVKPDEGGVAANQQA